MVKTKKFIFMKKLGFDVAFSKSEIHELLLKAIDIPRELREVALIVSSELPTEVTIRIELGVPSKKGEGIRDNSDIKSAEAKTRTRWSPWIDQRYKNNPEKQNEIMSIKIEDLDLSPRASNCLKGLRIRTLRALTRYGKSELSKIKNLGNGTLIEIESYLKETY